MAAARPPVSPDVELGLRNAGWALVPGINLAALVEVREVAESSLLELDALQRELGAVAAAVEEIGLVQLKTLSGVLRRLQRQGANLVEVLAEVVGDPAELEGADR
jgi:hypothetical protein